MVKLDKNRSENLLAFVSTRARSGYRPKWITAQTLICAKITAPGCLIGHVEDVCSVIH